MDATSRTIQSEGRVRNMELKQTKPIHLRCPKCGYDFSYNTNHIEEEIDRLKCEITSIKNQITEHKKEHPKTYRDTWYEKATEAMRIKTARLQQMKKARKATAVEIKMQTNRIFRQLVEQKLGKEETLKLIKEAEDQMVYYNWDMATQTFTRFEGA